MLILQDKYRYNSIIKIAKAWKQSKCPLRDEWIKKMQTIIQP